MQRENWEFETHRLQFLDLVRESCRRRPHVELPGDHVGDEAGAVFAEEGDPHMLPINSAAEGSRDLID